MGYDAATESKKTYHITGPMETATLDMFQDDLRKHLKEGGSALVITNGVFRQTPENLQAFKGLWQAVGWRSWEDATAALKIQGPEQEKVMRGLFMEHCRLNPHAASITLMKMIKADTKEDLYDVTAHALTDPYTKMRKVEFHELNVAGRRYILDSPDAGTWKEFFDAIRMQLRNNE